MNFLIVLKNISLAVSARNPNESPSGPLGQFLNLHWNDSFPPRFPVLGSSGLAVDVSAAERDSDPALETEAEGNDNDSDGEEARGELRTGWGAADTKI